MNADQKAATLKMFEVLLEQAPEGWLPCGVVLVVVDPAALDRDRFETSVRSITKFPPGHVGNEVTMRSVVAYAEELLKDGGARGAMPFDFTPGKSS